MSKSYKQELLAVLAIAKRVGHFQIERQSTLGKINLKEDRSPFTEIDVTSENMIRDDILDLFPEDGFLGEETGTKESTNGRTWIVDPLDGTRPYIHNIPTFSTLIALEENGEIVVGVCTLHGLGETYWATKGGGAFCNGKPIHVSKTATVSDSMGTALGLVEAADTDTAKKLYKSMQGWEYTYGFMDAYSYMSVAAGKLEACVSLIDMPWDRGPAAIIVAEAGGRATNLAGVSTLYDTHYIVTNGAIHDELLGQLQ